MFPSVWFRGHVPKFVQCPSLEILCWFGLQVTLLCVQHCCLCWPLTDLILIIFNDLFVCICVRRQVKRLIWILPCCFEIHIELWALQNVFWLTGWRFPMACYMLHLVLILEDVALHMLCLNHLWKSLMPFCNYIGSAFSIFIWPFSCMPFPISRYYWI